MYWITLARVSLLLETLDMMLMYAAYPNMSVSNSNVLCVNLHVLPYQLYKSKLDVLQVAEMIKHAC